MLGGESGGVAFLSEFAVKVFFGVLDFILPHSRRIVYTATEPPFALIGNQQVNTQTVVIQNLGRKEVENVRVIHNWPTGTFGHSIFPLRGCQALAMAGNNAAFVIDFVRTRECVFITYVYATPPQPQPLLNSIFTSERDAARIPFPLGRRYSNITIAFIGVLATFGTFSAAHFVIKGFSLVWAVFHNIFVQITS